MLSFVVTRRMLNESSHLEYALRKYGDASFNADSQSDLTKLPQISVACRDLGVGPRTGYLTPPVQRLNEQVSDPGEAARIAVYASDVVGRIKQALPSLEASIATISSKKNVRVKSEGIMHVASLPAPVQGTDGGNAGGAEVMVNEDSDNECMEYVFDVSPLPLGRVVARFLCNPSSINQPTTEAHSCCVNPRRYVQVHQAV